MSAVIERCPGWNRRSRAICTPAWQRLRPCPPSPNSALVGKGHAAAGQAGACLHTMAVLQAYQADLLKELDEGEEVKSDDISELRRTADLSLRATKDTTRAISRSMAALVAAERHLWLTLSDMKQKERVSSSWTLHLRLLACSATPSIPLSTGTRRPVNKRRRSSGSSLTPSSSGGCWAGAALAAY